MCVFRVTDRQTPSGTFVRGTRLRGSRWTALVSELRRTPPLVRACSALGNRFAVLLTATADATYVELDGCGRILTPDGGFRQATTAVLTALRGV